MSYKNTMKLIASNFSLVWKQVLYFIVCFIILFICTYEVAKPIINIFVEDGVSGEVVNLVDSIYTM